VVDAGDVQKNRKIEVVNKVLAEIGASHVPQLQVLNKIDKLDGFEPRIDYDVNNLPTRVWLSAVKGQGLNLLEEAIKYRTSSGLEEIELTLLPHASKIRAALYQNDAVISEEIDPFGNFYLNLLISRANLNRIFAAHSVG
jgi:GTPase